MIAITQIPLSFLLISLLALSPLSAVKQNGKTGNQPKDTPEFSNNVDLFSKVYIRNLQFANAVTNPMYMKLAMAQRQKMSGDQNSKQQTQNFIETLRQENNGLKNSSSKQKYAGIVNPYYFQAMLMNNQQSWNPDKLAKSSVLDNRDRSVISKLKQSNRTGKRSHTIELHKKHNHEHYEIANLAQNSSHKLIKDHANAKLNEMKEGHAQMKNQLKDQLQKISGKNEQEISQEIEHMKHSGDKVSIIKQEKPTLARKDSKSLTDEEYNNFINDIKERAGARLGERDFYKVYSQVAHEHGLNFDEYLLKFGDAHFNSFMDHEPEFTDKGQDFVQNVGKGLQNALMDTSKLTKEILEDPQAFKIFAFDSHVDIYVDNGLQDILLESPIQNTKALLHCYLWPVIMTEKVNSGRNALEVVEKIVKNDAKIVEGKIVDSLENLVKKLEADRIMEGAIREKYERLGIDYDLIFKNIRNKGEDQEEQINRLKQHIAQEELLRTKKSEIEDHSDVRKPSQGNFQFRPFVFGSSKPLFQVPDPVFIKKIVENMKTQDTKDMIRKVCKIENQFIFGHKYKDTEELEILVTKGPRKKSILLNDNQILSRKNELDREINNTLNEKENQSYIQKMTGKFMDNMRYYSHFQKNEPTREEKSLSSTSQISKEDPHDKSFISPDNSQMINFGNQIPNSNTQQYYWSTHIINEHGEIEKNDFNRDQSTRQSENSPITRSYTYYNDQSSYRSNSPSHKTFSSNSMKQSQISGNNNRESTKSVNSVTTVVYVEDTIIENDSNKGNESPNNSPSHGINNFYRVLI